MVLALRCILYKASHVEGSGTTPFRKNRAAEDHSGYVDSDKVQRPFGRTALQRITPATLILIK
ncbi:hypothetical protein A2U01_0008563 [Trifolium medium]|uniref:Uncharacterized protein n=1 Tax=Trifolium medium TaxID=97028 RepID=A0A392MJK6_9FABA|nr:hypothetical protein [Trifolium medium]